MLFEQPEIHLHTVAAKPLAEVFADTARRGIRIVAETHSPQLVWATIGQIEKGNLSVDDVAIYRARRSGKRTVLNHLEIDPAEIDIFANWESGISLP